MNTMLKRIVSMFLCFVLVAGYLPAGALAAETDETVVTAAAEATNAPSVVELSDEATVVVEEEAAEAEENEEESLTADTGDPEEAVSEEANTSEEAPAEEETSDEVTSDEETSEEEITEEETSEEATEEAAAFELEAAPVDVSLLDAEAPAHVDAAIFFSDLHTNKSDYKETTVKNIMTSLKNTGLKFSSVTSCGDAFSVNEDNSGSNGPYTGYTNTITGYIRSVFEGIPVSYVWSDHDRYAVEADNTTLLNKTSRLVYGAGTDGVYGTDDDGNYYVYSLSMGDLCSYDRYSAGFNTDNGNSRSSKGFTATVQQAVKDFQADAAKLKKDRPLFIASHQPLFDKRNDNAFAELWFDAINEVATGMDVAFFYGHNHKYDEGNDYYYAKGSTMPVTTTNGWNGYQTGSGYQYTKGDPKPVNKTLNFTHMCAGYLAPGSTGSTSDTTREGTAVAVTIFEDSIQYVTYNANGKYTGNYKLDATVTRDHAKAEVEKPTGPSQPVTPEVNTVPDKNGTGITVTAPGVTGVSASVLTAETGLTEAQAAVSSVISGNVVAYDIRVEGFVNNSGTASVTLPIPAGMDAAKFVVYHVAENGAAEKMTGAASSDGTAYTFETDHFSVFVGGQERSDVTVDDNAVSGSGRLVGESTYGLATSITSGRKYLIGRYNYTNNRNDNYFLSKNGSASSAMTLAEMTASVNLNDYLFTFEEMDGRYSIKDADGEYVYPNGALKRNGTWEKRELVSNSKDRVASDVTAPNNGAVNVSRQITRGATTKSIYLTYNGVSENLTTVYLIEQKTTESNVSVNFKLQKPAEMDISSTQNLTYQIELSNGAAITSKDITWSVTNQNGAGTNLATVNNGVLSSGANAGTVYVQATLNSVNGTALVNPIVLERVPVVIKAPVVTLDVTPDGEITLAVGNQLTLDPTVTYNGDELDAENYTINWTSSNPDVVSVNAATGEITAVAVSDKAATITATVTKANNKNVNVTAQVSVTVIEKPVSTIAVNPSEITVFVGTNLYKKVATLVITYTDGTTGEEPLTLHDLGDDITTDVAGSTFTKTITRSGKTATATVKVIEKVVNNYPEYPDEGAVKVSKTGTGIDFQSSGIAQVEIAASGVPMKKGADVIVMLDTSSSMTKNTVTGTNKSRAEVLEESLANLIAYFKTPGEDGEPMDLRVAIADFNGYYGDGSGGTSGTPYDRTSGDYVKNGDSNGSGYSQPSKAQVYTGDKKLGAGAFIDAADLANTYTLNYTSGTNYDYAFDAIYQLGTAIKTEDRDLYVIFMSDGASLQWNYFGTQNTYNKWNNWLAGTWTKNDLTTSNLNSTKHSYFYDLNDHDGDGHINEHRMANAIKGDPTVDYEIIRKSTAGLPEGTLTKVKDYLYTVKGLGATMFTINFDARDDGNISEANIDKALASTASDQTGTTKYYYKVTTAAELENAFDAIGSEIAYAAYNARFVDQMGANYNLQMKTSTYKLKDNSYKTLEPKIEIISYDIYTRQEYLDGKITADKIGDRKDTFKILETVTFNADGTEAYSDQIGEGVNILADGTEEGFVKGVIYANTFLYNTNQNAVAVNGVNIPTGKDSANLTTGSTNELPAETFYWKMGTVQSSELAMRYYVYLDGSMEGTREAGSYPTNTFATLYYDNYVGNPCYKDTVSPVLAWKEANVSYAFYLVNEKGEIIVNQNSGTTGSFANKIAVTNPAVYKQINLNNVDTLDIASLNVVPDGYKLYDATYDDNGNATKGATYTVRINSNTTGQWDITSVKGGQTTYVMQYDPNNSAAYSKKTAESSNTLDYTHTVVWFAVVWSVGAYPDSVVIDYGLPVDISVLSNDMFGDYGSLAGVGDYNTEGLTETGHTDNNVLGNDSYTGTFGTATANAATGKVRYELNKSNGMQMNTYEKFGYAVNYIGSNAGYYYSSVTVIPATTIYYEDSFLDFASYHTVDEDKDSVADTYVENGMTMVKYEKDTTSAWTLEGNGVSGATQSEDRPGKYALQDANNIYGYDGVNKGMSMHSLNQARKVYVSENSYATASFQFAGTGFDVISMTSNTTGAIAVQVKAAENIVVNNTQKYAKGAVVKSFFVNTYYGYTQNANGEWEATPNVDQAIYQVPVLQVENLDYGKYDVTITATYSEYLDKTNTENGKKGYDLYLDAVRIYDPANDGAQDNDTVIEDAYKADGEGWPSYIELRNKLIAADTILGNYGTEDEPITGVVFIDGDGTVGNDQIADYISYGPNNEVYLAPGQRVAFMLSNVKNNTNIAGIHIGIKSADGKTCKYTIANYAQNDTEGGASAGDMYHEKISTVDTTTDMYYDLTDWRNDIIVISNTGSEGILSLTNIKATYKNNPNGTVATGDGNENDGIMVASELDETSGNEVDVYMTPRAAMLTLRSMNAPAEEEIPEPSVPETSEPEETLPEETKPGKPGKDEKPGKPGKDEKPGKPGKDEKPGKPSKPGKDEKPSKPGKDEKTGKAKKG